MPGNFVTVADRVSALIGRTRYPLMLPLPLWRGHGLVGGLDPVIGPGDLLAQSVIRHQRIDNRRRRQAADRQPLHTVHKGTATNLTMNKVGCRVWTASIGSLGFVGSMAFSPAENTICAPARVAHSSPVLA